MTRVLLILACLIAPLRAQTANETAQYLAGLPVRGTALEEFSRDQAWVDHATGFDKSWRELEARQLKNIRAWGTRFLGDAAESRGPMFYFFSGPDSLYAQAFYPNATTYILCGLEPVGPVPDVTKLNGAMLDSALANLRKSLNSVLSFSFFITKDMKSDLQQTQLSGTLPVLYVFLARAGCRIESVEPVGLDKAGALTDGKAAVNGVKIVFFAASGRQQTLYYFTTDLADYALRNNRGFLAFCERQGRGVSLVKAASYLMHLETFSTARDFLLSSSDAIVQDDSGIPIRHFDLAKWNLRLFGTYPGPIEIFQKHTQPDLAALFAKSNPVPIEFGFGYRWHASQSGLLLATPKPTTTP